MEAGERQLVMAAQAGDPAATDQLMSRSLPLVYNVVGRALDGHADVDDIVQDTLLRALRGLGGLREPERFRGWLVTIAMNQVRRRWTSRQRTQAVALESVPEPAAPDFAETTVSRLGLSDQRRELAEATRWLDAEDRDLLALWWLEASGELTRAELAAALNLPAAHAAVRIHRMKDRLDLARSVVAALSAADGCAELRAVTADWDGRPAPVWRKRLARHVKACPRCGGRRTFRPAEALLAGMLLVPPPPRLTLPVRPASAAHALPSGRGLLVPAVAGGALVVAAAVWFLRPDGAPPPAAAPAPAPAATTAKPTPAPSSEPAPRLLERSAVPRPTRPPTVSAEVVRLVNVERAGKGCRPVTTDPRLTRAAARHSAEMAKRREMTHAGADGSSPGDRISAEGYRWSAWAENVAVGSPTPSGVMTLWMNSPGHRANILNCSLTRLGVGLATGDGKLWWTQVFASPA